MSLFICMRKIKTQSDQKDDFLTLVLRSARHATDLGLKMIQTYCKVLCMRI